MAAESGRNIIDAQCWANGSAPEDWGGHPEVKREQPARMRCAHVHWSAHGTKAYVMGEALYPGPAKEAAEDECVLQTLNITSLPKYLPEIMKHAVDSMFSQKHTMKQRKAQAILAWWLQPAGPWRL
eukprot:8165034-Alexandrium_andersonii.AAC.1